MTIGFNSYDDPVPVPSVSELLASLTGLQRVGVLNGFAERKSVVDLKGELSLRSSIIIFFYAKLKEMEMKASELMNGEVVISEDPLTYNAPPSTATELATDLEPFFTDFTSGQLAAVVNKIIAYSKYNGSGDWDFYSSKITG